MLQTDYARHACNNRSFAITRLTSAIAANVVIGIFLQAPVAHLGKSEPALQDMKHMLYPGPDFRFGPVATPFLHTQRLCQFLPGNNPVHLLQKLLLACLLRIFLEPGQTALACDALPLLYPAPIIANTGDLWLR